MSELMLSKCKPNIIYCIYKIDVDDKNLLAELNNLGFKRGGNIELRFSNYGKKSFLVSVMGINYALDKVICEKIWVYDK